MTNAVWVDVFDHSKGVAEYIRGHGRFPNDYLWFQYVDHSDDNATRAPPQRHIHWDDGDILLRPRMTRQPAADKIEVL